VLDSVEPEYREYMIQGRNAAQKESNAKAEQQNQKRTASVAARNDDSTTGNTTIRSVQFDDDDTPTPHGASSQFGATGRKNRKLMAANYTNRRIGKSLTVNKPTNYHLRA
jgi:sRNA-binding protein